MLQGHGDHPGILHNLVMITSEQEDAAAYHRYWRRLIKVLLWRIMRGDQPLAAWDDLVRFYSHVALTTDREFAEGGPKVVDKLRRPDLLARWVEARAALIWLDAAARPYRGQQIGLPAEQRKSGRWGFLGLMRSWTGAFYPEFLPYVDWRTDLPRSLVPPGKVHPRVLPDPAETLLKRFAEWSQLQFGLSEKDQKHVEAVVLLAECVARIPVGPYVRIMDPLLRSQGLSAEPFRQRLQSVCTLALRARIDRLWAAENWKELAEWAADPDLSQVLNSTMRFVVGMVLCRLKRVTEALDLGINAVRDMQEDELKEKDPRENGGQETALQSRDFFKSILIENLNQIMEAPAGERTRRLAELRQRLEQMSIPESAGASSFRVMCLEVVEHGEIREQIDKAIEASKKLVDQGSFTEAYAVIGKLPDRPKEVADLKQNLISQIREVENQQHAVEQENARLKRELARRGVHEAGITQMAIANNLDTNNPFAMNALLKAIKDHLG